MAVPTVSHSAKIGRREVRIYSAEISRRWMQMVMSSFPGYGTIPFLNGLPTIPEQFKARMTPWSNARLHNTSQCRQVGREYLHKFKSDHAPNCGRECWVGIIATLVVLLEPFRPIIMRRWRGRSLESAPSHTLTSCYIRIRKQHTVLRSRSVSH